MIVYINCVLLDEERENVVLLTKTKGPAFLIGKDNFPGGKLEMDETPSQGAIREVGEETGVRIPPECIALLHEEADEDYRLFTLVAFVPRAELQKARTMEHEPVRIESIARAYAYWTENPQRSAPNLAVRLAQAQCFAMPPPSGASG